MNTLTVSKARQNLGEWLKRALNGEDIGIVEAASGKIVALRPVEVYSEDYALMEYGLTDTEMNKAVGNVNRRLKHEKATRWDGTAKSLRG